MALCVVARAQFSWPLCACLQVDWLLFGRGSLSPLGAVIVVIWAASTAVARELLQGCAWQVAAGAGCAQGLPACLSWSRQAPAVQECSLHTTLLHAACLGGCQLQKSMCEAIGCFLECVAEQATRLAACPALLHAARRLYAALGFCSLQGAHAAHTSQTGCPHARQLCVDGLLPHVFHPSSWHASTKSLASASPAGTICKPAWCPTMAPCCTFCCSMLRP